MDNKGQMAATEFIVIIVLLLLCIGMGWYIVTKKTDMTVYQNGSKPKVSEFSPKPGFGGCVRQSVIEEWSKDESNVNKVNGH